MVVLFEGIDTCGKSTQIALIKQKYPDILTTHEPGATGLGKTLREVLLQNPPKSKEAEALLFLADRAEHYETLIKPNKNKLIISDRGFVSGIAYAMATGKFELDTLIKLNRFALQGDFPQKTVLFTIDEKTLLQRLSKKAHDKIEARGITYLLEVQRRMIKTVQALKLDHLIIDASDDIETIHQTILTYLKL